MQPERNHFLFRLCFYYTANLTDFFAFGITLYASQAFGMVERAYLRSDSVLKTALFMISLASSGKLMYILFFKPLPTFS